MKRLYLVLMAVVVLLVFAFVKNEETSADFNANVEALAQGGGAVIVCDGGICGQCFYAEAAWPFYKCNWSGIQDDYCDCDKAGYLK